MALSAERATELAQKFLDQAGGRIQRAQGLFLLSDDSKGLSEAEETQVFAAQGELKASPHVFDRATTRTIHRLLAAGRLAKGLPLPVATPVAPEAERIDLDEVVGGAD